MKPGRELDALVAEKVMGLKISKEPDPWDGGETEDYFVSEPDGLGFRPTNAVKNYSTDITAAWEVVEKMGTMNHSCFLSTHVAGVHCANFVYGQDPVGGESIPHAICLAALKAVGG